MPPPLSLRELLKRANTGARVHKPHVRACTRVEKMFCLGWVKCSEKKFIKSVSASHLKGKKQWASAQEPSSTICTGNGACSCQGCKG